LIFLDSFSNIKKYNDAEKFSVSRWQPNNSKISELMVLAPQIQGKKFEDFNSPEEFYELYLSTLRSRWDLVRKVFNDIKEKNKNGKNIALFCWCTIKQQRKKGYETIMCHRIPLGFALLSYGIPICYDEKVVKFGIDYKDVIKNNDSVCANYLKREFKPNV